MTYAIVFILCCSIRCIYVPLCVPRKPKDRIAQINWNNFYYRGWKLNWGSCYDLELDKFNKVFSIYIIWINHKIIFLFKRSYIIIRLEFDWIIRFYNIIKEHCWNGITYNQWQSSIWKERLTEMKIEN